MPTPPRWQFILTDLAGNQIGEITQADSRTVTLPLNRVPTASFTLPLWHPLASSVLALNCLLKVYRRDQVTGTNRLVFHGPLVSAEEAGSSDGQTIGVSAAGPMWRLTKRFIGTTKGGILFGNPGVTANPTAVPPVVGVDPVLIDLGTIAQQILTAVNGVFYTGIANGSTGASTNGVYGTLWLKNAGEAVAELSAGLNSFDYDVAPQEPGTVINGHPTIGTLNITSIIGQNRPDAIFEYGTPRGNVASYNRKRDYENVMNDGYISLSGWPDGVTAAQDLIRRTDTTSRDTIGLYQDIANDAGVIDDGLRTLILDAHIAARKSAREILTFTVASNARPAPFTDYIVGDYVRARAVVRGSVRFDTTFRIWGVTFKIDQNGNEALDLQLVQDA